MGLSFITPHYNDLEGLQRIYTCLQAQTLASWDWVIVDDTSDFEIQKKVKHWIDNLQSEKVQLYLNTEKTNASVCRNLGADIAKSDTLVFLDADDFIGNDFVHNRQIVFNDFAVFINYSILNEKGEKIIKIHTQENYLNNFLAAKFLWQTSCILWNRSFFKKIGQFNPSLMRLQDVELSIRALQNSTDYSVVNNPIDFYYQTKPMRLRKNFVLPVCDAVYVFISKLLQTDALSKYQVSLVSGYYFLCVRYLERSGSKTHTDLVQRNLTLFYEKKYICFKDYSIACVALQLYKLNVLSGKQFLRINRYLFKPQQI
ncbi:glycosyltransferase family 2 protein [Psychroserpens burtonensis]|uniref:glycosyltransferase family 2 protein n=1 Tax=Psychroserpens burtonensis TaxID=49278 RepID=UPI0003F94602|nr:glycosyltransferase family A protein [Psychroserpens burtonensis]